MKKGVFIYGLTDVKSISKPTGVDKKVLAQIHAINAAGLNCKHFYTKRESWVSPTLNKKAPWCNFPSFRCFSRVQKFFFKNIKRVFFVFLLDIHWTILYLDIIKCSMAMIFSTFEGWGCL